MAMHVTLSQNLSSEDGSSAGINPGGQPQIVQISYTPPPSHNNINLSSGHPANIMNARSVPPSYDEVIDRNAPPPSYDSLFGRVREVHKRSEGVYVFLWDIILLLLGTIGYTIVIGMTLVIPVCMMIIGGVYLYDCPQGEYIPVYLLVGGGFGVFKQLLSCSARVRPTPDERNEERMRQSPVMMLIDCFTLGWFIIGSMWVYKEYEPNYDPALGKYCNKTLYLFAFWLVTSLYIIMGVFLTVVCCVSVTSVIFQRRPPDGLAAM